VGVVATESRLSSSIIAALESSQGSIEAASKVLDVPVRTLERYVTQLGLRANLRQIRSRQRYWIDLLRLECWRVAGRHVLRVADLKDGNCRISYSDGTGWIGPQKRAVEALQGLEDGSGGRVAIDTLRAVVGQPREE
jgi:hypothetical protein